MKYQFCIRFKNIDFNSSASKAVLDCSKIFSDNGYNDYTFTVGDNSDKKTYYIQLAKELIRFFFAIRRHSIVGIQYPLLSINEVFKYFIKISKIKRVRFMCVVHDLESLRQGGNAQQIDNEVKNLSYYDIVIVHNQMMKDWLVANGLKTQIITLELFDYLYDGFDIQKNVNKDDNIVFAGNLAKSTFVYALDNIPEKKFTLYGPGFAPFKLTGDNVNWGGVYSPDEIPEKLKGSYGLIWDGSSIDECDSTLGNYLFYNNPHKASLYLAAGMPLIAPEGSAIGKFIKKFNIGVLVNNLHDIGHLNVDKAAYEEMRRNVLLIRKQVTTGEYFKNAIKSVENEFSRIQ